MTLGELAEPSPGTACAAIRPEISGNLQRRERVPAGCAESRTRLHQRSGPPRDGRRVGTGRHVAGPAGRVRAWLPARKRECGCSDFASSRGGATMSDDKAKLLRSLTIDRSADEPRAACASPLDCACRRRRVRACRIRGLRAVRTPYAGAAQAGRRPTGRAAAGANAATSGRREQRGRQSGGVRLCGCTTQGDGCRRDHRQGRRGLHR